MTPRDRSWRGSQFYRTPRGVRNRRVNHSKNVISTCNRTVFKLRSSNFTVTSTTPRDRSWRGSRFYRTPRGVRNKGLITQKRYFDVQSHSFQDKKFKLHRNVDDSSGQVVEGFTILPYPQRGQKWRVNHSKNVISTCNRTVFKLRSSNFTGTSMTPRDRSWRGSRFYRTPRGVRNKGLITQKTLFRRAIAQFSR